MHALQPSPSSERPRILQAHRQGDIDVFAAIAALDQASSIDGQRRKDGGVVYTPRAIADAMCALADPALDDAVFEPSCGRGVFVFALAERHLASHPAPDVHAALARSLRASDIDPEAVEDLRSLWASYWMGKGVASPSPIQALAEDSLFGSHSKMTFDLALGNPPYVRFQNLPADYRRQLQEAFPTCAKGNVDLFFAFVERSLGHCRRSCMIFPNSWMASSSGKALRLLLAGAATHVVDYQDRLVFDPVRAYVCVALAVQGGRAPSEPLRVQLGSLDPTAPWIEIPAGDARIRPAQWALSSKASAFSAAARSLGDIATLRSGIATLADSAYAIRGASVAGGSVHFADRETGQAASIPLALAPKKIKLTKVHSQADLAASTDRILFPYRADGSLIPFATLASESPSAGAFLAARKPKLALRDKGKQDKYPEWHAYGRKQGLGALPPGTLVAVATMAEGAIQCFEFDAALCGQFLFTSGFVLAPKPGHRAEEILAALRSPASWEWALSHGKPWAGSEGKAYRSYGARLLLSMPLPQAADATPNPS